MGVKNMYKIWLVTAANVSKNFKDIQEINCPTCARKTLDYLYIGDKKTRIGYLQVWCHHCLNGIHVSRVKIPEGAKMLSYDTEEDINEKIPRYNQITP